jgi:acetate kinase
VTGARLLTLNAGSSSLKFAVYGAEAPLPLLMSGQVSNLGDEPRLVALSSGLPRTDLAWPSATGLHGVLKRLFDWLVDTGWAEGLEVIGHRVVHGGRRFRSATVLTPQVLEQLAGLGLLAPLHQPFNLMAVAHAARRFPAALQVGAFDTAFHADQPRINQLYALPRELADEGVIAYGFHGLSYEYISGVLSEQEGPAAGGRAIVLHLGSGVSLCALDRGRSVATTMGFSALDGPPMSTRSGSVDPGVLLHLMQSKGMSAEAIAELLYHRSGLLGLSGISGDMVTLLKSTDLRAREALEVYVDRLARQIGALAAVLGGVDTLVFTAGVGENAAPIRKRVLERLAWIGAELEAEANVSGRRRITTPRSAVKALVIPTDEQVVIARSALRIARS